MIAAITQKAEIPPNVLFVKVFPDLSVQLDFGVLK